MDQQGFNYFEELDKQIKRLFVDYNVVKIDLRFDQDVGSLYYPIVHTNPGMYTLNVHIKVNKNVSLTTDDLLYGRLCIRTSFGTFSPVSASGYYDHNGHTYNITYKIHSLDDFINALDEKARVEWETTFTTQLEKKLDRD